MASFPTNGSDRIFGSDFSDTIRALAGDDRVFGRSGDDFLYGQIGNDTLKGDSGEDEIFGGSGRDLLDGGLDDDRLLGGGGHDTLSGYIGNDRLSGGGGTDLFNFKYSNTSANGIDTITDFDDRSDLINLGDYGLFSDLDTNGDSELTDADTWITALNSFVTRIDVGAALGFTADTEVLIVTNVINSPLDWDDFLFEA